MRLAAVVIALFAAAPALAQAAPDKNAPPPEGYYRDIPNAYDLLMRPVVDPNIALINGRSAFPECPAPSALTDEEKAARKADGLNFLQLMRESARWLKPGVRYSHYRDADGKVALCASPLN